jgi:hypothetical protein
MSTRKILFRLFRALGVASLLWSPFWLFCRPAVLLHYAVDARELVVHFLNDYSSGSPL